MNPATASPIVIDAALTRASLPFDRLIPALREAFTEGADVPLRHHHLLLRPLPRRRAAQLYPARGWP